MMRAPERFADWMSKHRHVDEKSGQTYLYHSRSDKHSIQLCQYVVEDLVGACSALARKAASGEVAYGLNIRFKSPSGKVKNLDFAIGPPARPLTLLDYMGGPIAMVRELSELEISCEAKSTMTEHSKSKPRMYDELSSSHEIIHQGQPGAIATGIAVVNIAQTFISPLRQMVGASPIITRHNQPAAAQGMIEHLRGLKIRNGVDGVGFEAFCTIVLDCDNVACAGIYTGPPAPQPGDPDHYDTYVQRVAEFYEERFA